MVPEGTPAIYLGDLSHNPSEHELLLGRGMSFTIDAVWPQDDGFGRTTWHVQAHVSAFDGHPVEGAQGHGEAGQWHRLGVAGNAWRPGRQARLRAAGHRA